MSLIRRRGRWIVLATYLAALVLTQFSCYLFAPVLPVLALRYHVSATAASWTVLLFPLLSALTSGISGGVADRFGYRFCIRAGLLLIALFSSLRVCGGGFAFLLFCQAGIAIGIPPVVTSLSALVGTWFDTTEQPPMTALCTVSLFAGIGLALGVSPWLFLAAGFDRAMTILAGVAVLCCVVFFLAVPRDISPGRARAKRVSALWLPLLRNHNVLLLCAGGFLGQGCFNAVTTWIAVIWHERGFPLQAAGIASSAVVFAGILGSLVIPCVAGRWMDAKTALCLCLIPAVVLVHPFIWTGRLSDAYAYGCLMGFFQFPSLAITLTLLARSVPAEHSGLAAGLYWTTGNLGVFVLSNLIGLVHRFTGWHVAVDCISALLFLVLLLVAFLRSPVRTAASVAVP